MVRGASPGGAQEETNIHYSPPPPRGVKARARSPKVDESGEAALVPRSDRSRQHRERTTNNEANRKTMTEAETGKQKPWNPPGRRGKPTSKK